MKFWRQLKPFKPLLFVNNTATVVCHSSFKPMQESETIIAGSEYEAVRLLCQSIFINKPSLYIHVTK